jgi:hypothetical protein
MAEPGVRPHVELGEAKMVQIKQSRRSLALVAAALSAIGLLTGCAHRPALNSCAVLPVYFIETTLIQLTDSF